MDRKIDFMVIGAMKSGTSSVFQLLERHPSIIFSKPKETDFFQDVGWREKLHLLESFFEKSAETSCLLGEGSTSSAKYPEGNLSLHKDLFEYNPHLRFIYVVRNPVERIKSQYVHMYARGTERYRDINHAILYNPTYVNLSRYFMQIERYTKYFNQEQILVLDFEDLVLNPQRTMNEVANFLNIPNFKIEHLPHVNKRSVNRGRPWVDKLLVSEVTKAIKSLLNQRLRTYLAATLYKLTTRRIQHEPVIREDVVEYIHVALRNDISKLEELTGHNYSKWLKF